MIYVHTIAHMCRCICWYDCIAVPEIGAVTGFTVNIYISCDES